MKKLWLIMLMMPVLLSFKAGNQIDEKKMARDLEIAKNILATLIKTSSGSFFGGQSIEASYINGYGVVFTIPEHLVYFSVGSEQHIIEIPDVPSVSAPPYPDFNFQFDFQFDDSISEEAHEQARMEVEKAREEMERAKVQVRKNKEEIKVMVDKIREEHKLQNERLPRNDINWEDVIITFMTDYADLIGQLQPEDKIVINQKVPFGSDVIVWRGTSGSSERIEPKSSGISAEVIRKDVADYKSGKINRDEFVTRIKIMKTEPQKKVPDLEMFSGIIEKYYGYDLSETFYMEGKTRYELLDGYGAVFHLKASSPNQFGSRIRFYTPGERRVVVGGSEKSKETDENLYPEFKEDIQSFLLDYGRTIRSLQDDEKILLEIKLQACKDCKVPVALEVSTSISTLRQYDVQKLSKQKALAMIEVKEIF